MSYKMSSGQKVEKLRTNDGEVAENEIEEVSQDISGILPQLESWEKMMKIPVFENFVHQSGDAYQKVKSKWKLSGPCIKITCHLETCDILRSKFKNDSRWARILSIDDVTWFHRFLYT